MRSYVFKNPDFATWNTNRTAFPLPLCPLCLCVSINSSVASWLTRKSGATRFVVNSILDCLFQGFHDTCPKISDEHCFTEDGVAVAQISARFLVLVLLEPCPVFVVELCLAAFGLEGLAVDQDSLDLCGRLQWRSIRDNDVGSFAGC